MKVNFIGSSIFSFELALTMLKQGRKLARRGWADKRKFVFLVPGSTFNVNRPPLMGIFPEGTEVSYLPHIDMYDCEAGNGEVGVWTCSQVDVLATDWGEVE